MLQVLLLIFIKVSSPGVYDNTGTMTVLPDDSGKVNVITRTFDKGIKAMSFKAVLVDDENTKWFLTESGIVSFDNNKWQLHNKNRNIPGKKLGNFAFDYSSPGRKMWLGSTEGVIAASLPPDKKAGIQKFSTSNSDLISNNILAVTVSRNPVKWFGTDKGVSALKNETWLVNSYQRKYRERMFTEFPITSMATTPYGDTLYVGTDGAGIARLYRSNVDAVSGASEYAQWGPINMPSDNVYSICIAPDGTQWFGTDMGAARHTGQNTLRNWTEFNTKNGLINNFVQAIAIDNKGNIWFGTRGGISCFTGSEWSSYTADDGLLCNNILCIAVDRDNTIWFGTETGVISYHNEEFINYK